MAEFELDPELHEITLTPDMYEEVAERVSRTLVRSIAFMSVPKHKETRERLVSYIQDRFLQRSGDPIRLYCDVRCCPAEIEAPLVHMEVFIDSMLNAIKQDLPDLSECIKKYRQIDPCVSKRWYRSDIVSDVHSILEKKFLDWFSTVLYSAVDPHEMGNVNPDELEYAKSKLKACDYAIY